MWLLQGWQDLRWIFFRVLPKSGSLTVHSWLAMEQAGCATLERLSLFPFPGKAAWVPYRSTQTCDASRGSACLNRLEWQCTISTCPESKERIWQKVGPWHSLLLSSLPLPALCLSTPLPTIFPGMPPSHFLLTFLASSLPSPHTLENLGWCFSDTASSPFCQLVLAVLGWRMAVHQPNITPSCIKVLFDTIATPLTLH